MCCDDANNPLFFGWERVRRQKRDIHPADAIVRAGHVGRGLVKGGGVLLGRTRAYYLVEGTQGVNCIIAVGEKWLCRSIFVGKTDLGCGFGHVVARTTHANVRLHR